MDKRIIAKYWVNIGLTISFLVVFITGVIKFPGFLKSLGVNVKDLPWKQISLWHDWSGIVMGALVLFHLIQNWNWMAGVTKKIFSK